MKPKYGITAGGFSPASILMIVLIVAAASASGCRSDNDVAIPAGSGDPTGELSGHTGCKTRAALPGTEDNPSATSCVRYTYDGDGTLLFDHVNAAFNCCQDVIYASISIGDGTITVIEAEDPEGGLCDCLCLFDLNFVVRNLDPGVWTIKFIGPYMCEGGETIEFIVDLVLEPSGEHCVSRTCYPWGQ